MRILKWIGFTVLIAILVLAASIIGYLVGTESAYDKHSWKMKRYVAEGNVHFIASAITNYYARTGAWPCNRNGLEDVTFGKEVQQNEVIKILLGVDPLKSVKGASLLAIDRGSLVGDNYIDPWGMPYYIAFDTDGDGICKTERWGGLIGKGPFVWSEGGGAIRSWGTNVASPAIAK